MKKYKEMFKHACLISAFSIISIFSTVIIHNITYKKIITQKEQEKQILLKQVLPLNTNYTFTKKIFRVKNQLLGDKNYHNLWLLLQNNKPQGAIVETTAPDGYSGSINMLVASYFNGKIIGVRVLSHKETPGIGDKIEVSISNWINQFANMYISSLEDKNFTLKKYGGQIEQFTGATITPQSVTNCIKRTVVFIKTIPLRFFLVNKDINNDSTIFEKEIMDK